MAVLLHLLLLLMTTTTTTTTTKALASDTDALTIFRTTADAHGDLAANWTTPDACSGRWRGVGCSDAGRVTSLSLPSLDLRGSLDPLARLDQLRLLDLHGNRLNGTLLPLLTSLPNLELLYLSHNDISAEIPAASLGRLARLVRVDLSDNDLHGPLPAAAALANLTCLLTLRLQNNLLSGGIPDLSQVLPGLTEFDASNNELSGDLPPGMQAKFGLTSFQGNAGLCGSTPPLQNCSFFVPHYPSPAAASPSVVPSNPSSIPPISSSGGGQEPNGTAAGATRSGKSLSTGALIGIAMANSMFLLLVLSLLLIYCCCTTKTHFLDKGDKRISNDGEDFYSVEVDGEPKQESGSAGHRHSDGGGEASDDGHYSKLVFFTEDEEGNDKTEGESDSSGTGPRRTNRRRSAAATRKRFELEELLRASAEMLGKGTLGTVYRAVLEDGSMVAVKRLKDANPCPRKDFHRYMDLIGRLRHPNLVSLRAYYYAKQEKLLIYDYLPNSNLFYLLHGNRGPGRVPLDWTTRISLVLGASRGLAQIHDEYSSSKVPHGNVKSSNVLLDKNGAACLSDFGLALLIDPAQAIARSGGYTAPEQAHTKRLSQEADVYSFGVLVLEVLTGRTPTQYLRPPAAPSTAVGGALTNLPEWVRSVVKEEWTAEVFDVELLRYKNIEEEMVRMLHVGLACTARQPEQRPTMSDVVRMMEEFSVGESPLPEEEAEEYESRGSLSPSPATITTNIAADGGRKSY